MEEARRANLAAVRPRAAVADQVHAEFALRRLDGGVCLARGPLKPSDNEVVDERLHARLHVLARALPPSVAVLMGPRQHVEALPTWTD